MLTNVNFMMIGLTVLFLVLAIARDNLVFSAIALALGGSSTLFWADSWDALHSEFVVENASAKTVENLGTWVEHTQSYQAPGATAYIPAMLTIVSFLAFVYLSLKLFKTEGEL